MLTADECCKSHRDIYGVGALLCETFCDALMQGKKVGYHVGCLAPLAEQAAANRELLWPARCFLSFVRQSRDYDLIS
jgi:hypothetical protein